MNNFSIPKKIELLIDQGTYLAKIESLEPSDGDYGKQVKFNFKLLEIKEDVTKSGWAPYIYSESSKLFKWTKAALGNEFDPNADFQSEKLIERKVLLNITKRFNKKGIEKNHVEDVLPPPRKSSNPVTTKIESDDLPEPQENWPE